MLVSLIFVRCNSFAVALHVARGDCVDNKHSYRILNLRIGIRCEDGQSGNVLFNLEASSKRWSIAHTSVVR